MPLTDSGAFICIREAQVRLEAAEQRIALYTKHDNMELVPEFKRQADHMRRVIARYEEGMARANQRILEDAK